MQPAKPSFCLRYLPYLTSPRPTIAHINCSFKLIERQTGQRRNITVVELDRLRGDKERIVILGSGWAGYPLARALDYKKYQAVIVSPRSYFVFTPLLASTSVGTLEFRTALEPVRSRRNKAHYIQGWADDVDFYNKTVTIEEAAGDPLQGLALTGPRYEDKAGSASKTKKGQVFNIGYDKLVIGVGCYSQTFGTPGVREHANFLKDIGDARKIRKKLLECCETASLPTTSDEVRRQILNWAVVGGGPTGIEFSAELHDFIEEDMARLYPELKGLARVTVYDVAPKVLSMFDENLAKYATDTFKREGISIKTSRIVQELRPGLPNVKQENQAGRPGLTLKVQGEGDIGIGMCIWSTGLAMNPFIKSALSAVRQFPEREVIFGPSREDAAKAKWAISRDVKTGSILTTDRLRVMLEAQGADGVPMKAVMRDVFAIGDCAILEGTHYPATAQVANQKGKWLAKRLNKEDLQTTHFTWKNLGLMAYIGNWNAILQGGQGVWNVSGRTAWFIWRGAYLAKTVSWRNRVLIPIYWFLNWAFGRDISRF